MAFAPRHPPSKRIAVRDLMRDSDLSAQEISGRTGVPYPTVCKWNQKHAWRPSTTRTLGTLRVRDWPTERIVALARVHEVPGVDPGDLAEALGTHREKADALFRACGFPAGMAQPARGGRTGDGLRTALRVHVARQIAAFDAMLSTRRRAAGANEPAKAPDTAKILRDLGGLKRLLDDLDKAARPPQADPEEEPMDLVALRERILRRYEAFARAEANEPAAGP